MSTLSGMSVLAWNTLNVIHEAAMDNILTLQNFYFAAYVVLIGIVWGYFSGRRWEKEAWRDCSRTHTNDVNWTNGHKVSTKHGECAHSVLDHIYGIRKLETEYVDIRKYGEKKLIRNGFEGDEENTS